MSSPSFSGAEYDTLLSSGARKQYTYTLDGTSYPLDIVFEAGTWKFITDNTDLQEKIVTSKITNINNKGIICIPDSLTAAKGLNQDKKRTRCIEKINEKIVTLNLVPGHPDPSSATDPAKTPSMTSPAAPKPAVPPSAVTSSATASTVVPPSAKTRPTLTNDPSDAVFKDVVFLDKTYPNVNQAASEEGILYKSQKDLVDALFIGHLVTSQPTKFKDILQAIIDGECATDMPIITKTTCKPVRQWIRELMKLYLDNMDNMAAATAAPGGPSATVSGVPVPSATVSGVPVPATGAKPGTPVPATGPAPGTGGSSTTPAPGSGTTPVSSSSASGPGAPVPSTTPVSSTTPAPTPTVSRDTAATEAINAEATDAAFNTLLAQQATAKEAADTYNIALTRLAADIAAAAAKKKEAEAKAAAAENAYTLDTSETNQTAVEAANAAVKEATAVLNSATTKYNETEIVYNKANRGLTTISESVNTAHVTRLTKESKDNATVVKTTIDTILNDAKGPMDNIGTVINEKGDPNTVLTALNDTVAQLEKNKQNAEQAAIRAEHAAAEASTAAITEEAKAAAQEASLIAKAARTAATMAATVVATIHTIIQALSDVASATPGVNRDAAVATLNGLYQTVEQGITNARNAMTNITTVETAPAVTAPAETKSVQKRITITIDIPKKAFDDYFSESKTPH
jgi:hypothetical protein